MPTLIIGLGGTGTSIVRRARQRFQETLGGVPSNVGMCIIDAQKQSPEEGPIDDVRFYGTEPINYPQRFEEFSKSVREWFPANVTPNAAIDFSDGCGAVRAHGKFFAFYYAPQIRTTLEEEIQSMVRKGETLANDDAKSFDVYLTGSLGNGTCGGTFMDVAAMVRDMLAEQASRLNVYGVFLPGSVTRRGPHTTKMALRVGASGYASLIELQHQFNRRAPDETMRPKEPYEFEAWDGNRVRKFQAGRLQGDATLASPIDVAFLMDHKDRAGKATDYESLKNVAAESLIMLSGSTDRTNRGLDVNVHMEDEGRFGSLGAARLTVPTRSLREFVVAAHALRTLDLAADPTAPDWGDVLKLRTPSGHQTYAPASIAEHVDRFLEHVLGIKETGTSGDAGHNQLFDRFDEERKRYFADFSSEVDDAGRAEKPEEMQVAATNLVERVFTLTSDLEARRREALLQGPTSLWERAPQAEGAREGMGVRGLVNDQVRRFVDAGAFGLLLDWVREMKRVVRLNQDSVARHEGKTYVEANRAAAGADIDDMVGTLTRMSKEMLAWFKRGDLQKLLIDIKSHAQAKLEFLVWSASVQVAIEFYSVVLNHLHIVESAADRVVRRLGEPRMRNYLRSKRREAEADLDGNLERKRTNDGLKAEFYLGGSNVMRQRVLDEVQVGVDSSAVALLAGRSEQNCLMFADGLGSDVGEFEGYAAPVAGRRGSELVDGYRNSLEEATSEACLDALNDACSIDRVLEREARLLLEDYVRDVHENRDSVDRTRLMETRGRVHAATGVEPSLAKLDWGREYESAMRRGISYVIAGRLYQMLQYATPSWSVTQAAGPKRNLLKYTLVAYSSRASAVDGAMADMVESLQLLKAEQRVRATTDEEFDRHRIDIVCMEVGAHLDMLAMADDVRIYKDVVAEGQFGAHATQHFEDLGKQYLQRTGEQRSVGAALLALGELYGWIERTSQGNYSLAQGFRQGEDDQGGVIYAGMAKGAPVGPRGIDRVIEHLDSADGQQLCLALTHLVYSQIEAAAYGDGTDKIGWSGVGNRLADFSVELGERARSAAHHDHRSALETQSGAMSQLSADVKRLEGRRRPWPFEE